MPSRQDLQRPQAGTKERITWSPRLGEGYAGAYLLYSAGALMAQDGRKGDIGVAMHEVAVTAADTGRADFNQHLTGLGFVQVNFLNHQGLTILVQNGSLHLRAS